MYLNDLEINSMKTWKDASERVLAAFDKILKLDPSEVKNIGITVPIPQFQDSLLFSLLEQASKCFSHQPSLLEIQPPVYVVGDLHGNIFDLLRIFILSSPPPASRFLFLGDYVDRGQFSIEIIALLFALLVKFPQHIFLIRGNHEFGAVNAIYGFKSEIERIYSNPNLYERFNETFNWIPLTAKIGNSIFCVHGGISPDLTSWKQLEEIQRPISSCGTDLISDLVWSDPTDETKEYLSSCRGHGILYGKKALIHFAYKFGIDHIFRGHQVIENGVEPFANELLYTIFSCSNYRDSSGNRCGLIFISSAGAIQTFSLPPIDQIDRAETLIINEDGSFFHDEQHLNKSGFISLFSSTGIPTYQKNHAIPQLYDISIKKRNDGSKSKHLKKKENETGEE